MIRIAVCDDSEKDLSEICGLLSLYCAQVPELPVEIIPFSNSFDLFGEVEKQEHYDVYFVDLVMPGISGMDIIAEIRKKDPTVPAIILTNSKEYALEAYALDVTQYFIKPITKERLFKKLDLLFLGLRKTEEEFVLLNLSDGVCRVQLNNIICVELCDHIMAFYLADGAMLESKYLRTPFAEAAASILKDSRFLRPHHSFILNMNYVSKMTKQYFFMKNGRAIKISKQKSKYASSTYLEYLSKQWRS